MRTYGPRTNLENLHGTTLDLLHVYDSCIGWSVCKTPNHQSWACPCGLADLWDSIPHVGLYCSAFIQKEEIGPISTLYAMLCSRPWVACSLLNGEREMDVDGMQEDGG